MTKSRLPKSIRKFIRKEKARIRRDSSDAVEQEQKVKELYARFSKSAVRIEENVNPPRDVDNGIQH